jgi:hypothetical protein
MRTILFSAIAAGGMLLAAQVPALAQGAFAYPPNGLPAPTVAPAPAQPTPGRTDRYYDYDNQYPGATGFHSAPYDFYAPRKVGR